MPDAEFNSTLNPDGQEEQPAKHGDGEWFVPVLSPGESPGSRPKPKPKPRSFIPVIDKVFAENGWTPTPSTPPGSTLPDSASIVAMEGPDPTPVTTQGTSRSATATEILNWIEMVLLSETHLSNEQAGLVAFWVISTWFQEGLTVLPCLVITGSAYYSNRVLHVLQQICCGAALMAGFVRSDLEALRRCRTNLLSKPNLDKQTAHLISCLTDKRFRVAKGPDLLFYSSSTAIYAGENPETHGIQNSIHLSPINAVTPTISSPQLLRQMIQGIPDHLKQYREKNLPHVQLSTWIPTGLSSEMATMAAELGRCIVDGPALRLRLITLLGTHDKQRLSDLSNCSEALVLEASLNLCHQKKPQLLAGEIATEVNRLQKERGERITYSAENVGHLLKKLGLYTRRLGKSGRGLMMDLATITTIHKVAAAYNCVGLEPEENNLHCQLCIENKRLMQVM